MNDKSAIITGSTSGIGLAIAERLASKNYNILLNGFGKRDHIDNIISDIEYKYGTQVKYHNADMSNSTEIKNMIDFAKSEFKSIDILINNAGIQFVANIEEFPIEKWDSIIATNLSSSFHTIREILPHMKSNNFGRIINIASAHGLVGSVGKSAYVAAKHGIVGLTKVVALENARNNITCNAICPGWVKTPLVEKQIENNAKADNISIDDATINLLMEKQPSLKFVSTEEISELVCFLSSDSARSITGSVISIDGGWTAR
ncbi:MAG: 3-hydroxybutyrate dehydrogenase [Rickettsiales bacterium]|nr:MAG: 3-hydroxybutyrate dehydrogenase [Rickettsiales bacterium]